jgi:CRISPR-associated protein Cmr2
MTSHLLAFTVGPVQDFIASARRTRDLWFGSHLLSEISKAAAKSLRDQGGKLVFPAPASDADLEPGSPLNVANVIVAELDGGDPPSIARAAKEAAKARWSDFADQVFNQYQGVIRADIWDDQVGDVIEFYAAWHSYSPQTYQADRAALMRLLAARKRCRNFLPARGRAGVPKSSLDGLRESVLRPPREWPERSRRRLRLQEGEQLDVVGLVKRTWQHDSGNRSYPSVARIAADPWIRLLQSNEVDLNPLIAACRALGRDMVHEFDTTGHRGHPQYEAFPFEGTVLFRSRHRDFRKEAEIATDDSALARLVSALDATSRAAKEKGLPREPNPYLGVLVADGDRVGEALSKLESPDAHRELSRALAGFAAQAREIVHKHQGVLVYCGGDDVLAFVPVDCVLACARALHDAFGQALAKWSAPASPLALSVGLAIAHFMEPLEDLLGYGRVAEKHAKRRRRGDVGQENRNGFAVHVVKRGGGPVAVRANWSADSAKDPSQHLQQLAEWIATQSVPGRVAYDLYTLANVYESWSAESARHAIECDVLRVLEKKQPRDETKMPELASLIKRTVTDSRSLRRFAHELLVARAIGAAAGAIAGTDSP